jgi:hypothetical protein
MLLIAIPVFAEEVYLQEDANGKLIVSIGKPIVKNPAQGEEVTITLPCRTAAKKTVRADEGEEVTITLPGKATAKPQAVAAAPSVDDNAIDGSAVEVDTWTGRAATAGTRSTYVGGRVAVMPQVSEVNGAKVKVGPYVGANHSEWNQPKGEGSNNSASIGLGTKVSGQNSSFTGYVGMRYVDGEGQNKNGRYKDGQTDYGPEFYGQYVSRHQNENWLKQTKVSVDAYVPVSASQHNTWDGKAKPDKPVDNTRITGSLYQDVYTSDKSESGVNWTGGVSTKLGYAYGKKDTIFSFGPYLGATVNDKEVFRLGFSPELHNSGSTLMRYDLYVSGGGLWELGKNLGSRSVPAEEAQK